MSKFKKDIYFSPAFDKRNNDPKRNCGIHSMEMKFVLTGKLGAIQFLLYTGWYLPHVMKEFDSKPCEIKSWGKYCHSKPQPADIGYHSYLPRYQDDTISQKSCHYLGGKPCYYDGSSLQAEAVFDIFVSGGDKALWKELERQYQMRLVDKD